MLNKQKGFTLIELMIVAAILSISLLFAFVNLRHYPIRANRAEGKVALLDLASRLERYHTRNRTYVGATTSNLGLNSIITGNGLYSLSIVSLTSNTFSIQAIPQGAQATEDAECGTFELNQFEQKTITGTGTATSCWFE